MNNRTPSIFFILYICVRLCSERIVPFYSVWLAVNPIRKCNLFTKLPVLKTLCSRKRKAKAVHIVIRAHAIWYSNWISLKTGAALQSVCVCVCCAMPLKMMCKFKMLIMQMNTSFSFNFCAYNNNRICNPSVHMYWVSEWSFVYRMHINKNDIVIIIRIQCVDKFKFHAKWMHMKKWGREQKRKSNDGKRGRST